MKYRRVPKYGLQSTIKSKTDTTKYLLPFQKPAAKIFTVQQPKWLIEKTVSQATCTPDTTLQEPAIITSETSSETSSANQATCTQKPEKIRSETTGIEKTNQQHVASSATSQAPPEVSLEEPVTISSDTTSQPTQLQQLPALQMNRQTPSTSFLQMFTDEELNGLNSPTLTSSTAMRQLFDLDSSLTELSQSPNIGDRKMTISLDKKLDAMNKKLASHENRGKPTVS